MITRLSRQWGYEPNEAPNGMYVWQPFTYVEAKVNGKFLHVGRFKNLGEAEKFRAVVRKIREPKYGL